SGDAGTSDLTFTNVEFNVGTPEGRGIDGSIEVVPIPTEVTLALPDISTESDVSVEIPVTTDDIDGKEVFSYEFTVTFDPDIVTLDDVETNGTISENATVTFTTEVGSITVNAVSATALSGSGDLIILTGTSGDSGTSDLTFTDIGFNGGNPSGIGIDGSILVTDAPVVTLTLPHTGAEPNVPIEIPVWTEDIDGKDVFSYEFAVTYDPDVITLDGIKLAGTLSADAAVTVSFSIGRITLSATSETAISGSGHLILLTGRSHESGTSDLTFADLTFNDGRPVGIGIDGSIEVGVGLSTDDPDQIPGTFALLGNYPNPFNPSTTILFDLPETAEISIQLFDLLGRQVMSRPPTTVQAGADRGVQIEGSSLSSGTYIYRVIARSATSTMIKSGRLTLVK
ncbi:MAG: cohesin domain-containing protein, partial [Rhodothermales bacterium]